MAIFTLFKSPVIPLKSKLAGYHSLNWYDSIDLTKIYPISKAYALQLNAIPTVTVIFLWLIWLAAERLPLVNFYLEERRLVVTSILSLISIFVLCKLFFHEVMRRSTRIEIEGLRLNFSLGIFKKVSHSLVLRSWDVIRVHRTFQDYLFGVFRVQIYGSNLKYKEFALFPALKRKDAFDLFRFLHDELSKQDNIASDPKPPTILSSKKLE
jgi:hypothetical protein